MAIQTVPYALQNASHSAALFRQSASAPFVTGGILSTAELTVSQQGTPNMSVVLGPGRAKIPGTSVSSPLGGSAFTTQAMYDTLNDANLTLTVTTANATNPRIDAAYIQVQDAYYSGATNTAIAGVVAGVPAASPAAPAVPSNSILIGYIAVAANATTIVTANISYQATLAQLIPSTSQGMTVVKPTAFSGTGVSVSPNGKISISGGSTISITALTSAFANYKVIVRTSVSAATGDPILKFRLGSTDTSANYVFNKSQTTGGTTTNVNLPTTAMNIGRITTTGGGFSTLDLIGPQLPFHTFCGGFGSDDAFFSHFEGTQTDNTQFDGITIIFPGNVTADVWIYGYNFAT